MFILTSYRLPAICPLQEKASLEMRILPVILSGGAGTRLWPVSRADNPKQFQELHGEGTLLQQALGRLPAQEGIEPPIVI